MAVQSRHFTEHQPGFLTRATGWLRRRLIEFEEIRSRRARYLELASLDDRTLKDIGICRGEIMAAATDPRAYARCRQ